MSKKEDDIIHPTRVAAGSLVVLLMVGSIGSFVWWRIRLSQAVEKSLAALRAAGLPTSGAELNQWYPSVPDSENAALVLTQAFALMRTFPDQRSNEVTRFKPPQRGQPLTPTQVQLLSDYLTLNNAALERAAVAIRLAKSRYPADLTPGPHAQLPHLGKIKTLAQTASDEAILAFNAHRAPAAANSIKVALGLARTLDTEPLLISQLVRISIVKIARLTLELQLNALNASESELADLESAFASAEKTNLMIRALAGEQAMSIPCFRMSWEEIKRLAQTGEDGSSPPAGPPLSGPQPLLFRVTGFFECDLRFYLGVMRSNIALASLGPPKSLAATNLAGPVEAKIRSNRYIFSGLLLPAYSRALIKEAEGIANIRVCTTALALERFRLANHRMANGLSELVPLFVDKVPVDPFNGARLCYKHLPNGYVVYSVGPDGRDDGGKERPVNRRGTSPVPEDITITVER